jgi:DNA-binding response OmpR family regulator
MLKSGNRLDCSELVGRIAKMVRERVTSSPVVDFSQLRDTARKERPPVLWLIEDDESIRRALIRIFESENYRVFAASGATEIDLVLNSSAPDIILLDVGLPWINGFELAELMKSHADLSKVPIVFISGHDEVESIKLGFSVGAHDFIVKPFDVQTVRKTVRTLLELR